MGYFDHGAREPRQHLMKQYRSLTYLIGAELEILYGVELDAKPKEVRLIGDYPNTIMIEMEFLKDIWNPFNPKPRYVRQMIPKASLAVGDVKLIAKESGDRLYGSAIAPVWKWDSEVMIR